MALIEEFLKPSIFIKLCTDHIEVHGGDGTQMEFLECSKAKIGDTVVLMNPDPDYDIGPDNPAIGSSWFCGGVITKVESVIYVQWENGSNCYKDFELARLENLNIGVCESIW